MLFCSKYFADNNMNNLINFFSVYISPKRVYRILPLKSKQHFEKKFINNNIIFSNKHVYELLMIMKSHKRLF